MLIDEVHWCDGIQIPAQHIEQVNLTLFDSTRARVSSARELEMVACDQLSIRVIEEASVKTVSNKFMCFAELLNHWDVVIDLIKL